MGVSQVDGLSALAFLDGADREPWGPGDSIKQNPHLTSFFPARARKDGAYINNRAAVPLVIAAGDSDAFLSFPGPLRFLVCQRFAPLVLPGLAAGLVGYGGP